MSCPFNRKTEQLVTGCDVNHRQLPKCFPARSFAAEAFARPTVGKYGGCSAAAAPASGRGPGSGPLSETCALPRRSSTVQVPQDSS